MPRNVRNFWIEADIDGRLSMLAGGPRAKSDGMRITLSQRNDGCVDEALEIRCYESHSHLYTKVYHKGKLVYEYHTHRNTKIEEEKLEEEK